MRIFILILFFLLVNFSNLRHACADIYKYSDVSTGKIFYTDCRAGRIDYYLIIKTKVDDKNTLIDTELKSPNSQFRKACNEPDFSQAIYWLYKAAEQNHSHAQKTLGDIFHYGQGLSKDDNEALRWYLKAASQGEIEAQITLAYMFRNGLGTKIDYDSALYWYEQAALQGNTSAQNELGLIYKNGVYVIQNYKESIKWFRLAANQYNISAMENLGLMYFLGDGVAINLIEAHKWLNLSASAGNMSAISLRNKVERYMNTEQKDEAQNLARDWKAKFEKTVNKEPNN